MSSAHVCSYSRGMRGKALLRLGLSQLAAIALICGVRIPFTIGLPDAADIAHVAITMKCEHRVVFSRVCEIAGGAIFSSAVPLYYSCYCVWRASLGMDILNALWSEAVSFLSQGASVVYRVVMGNVPSCV